MLDGDTMYVGEGDYIELPDLIGVPGSSIIGQGPGTILATLNPGDGYHPRHGQSFSNYTWTGPHFLILSGGVGGDPEEEIDVAVSLINAFGGEDVIFLNNWNGSGNWTIDDSYFSNLADNTSNDVLALLSGSLTVMINDCTIEVFGSPQFFPLDSIGVEAGGTNQVTLNDCIVNVSPTNQPNVRQSGVQAIGAGSSIVMNGGAIVRTPGAFTNIYSASALSGGAVTLNAVTLTNFAEFEASGGTVTVNV